MNDDRLILATDHGEEKGPLLLQTYLVLSTSTVTQEQNGTTAMVSLRMSRRRFPDSIRITSKRARRSRTLLATID